jgi:dolichyl-phosphate-mannose--protein O-mannosyl transferase
VTLSLLESRRGSLPPMARHRESELADRLWPAFPADRGRSWLVTLGVTAVAAALRWPSLSQPHAFSFDETYYAKDAFSLLQFGYERSFVDGANDQILASNGDPATLQSVFESTASFVVHPPAGKWVIAIGEQLFGVTPFGWRFMTAVLGTLAVLATVRIGRRLTRSTLIGAGAGLFVAIDGMAIVHSRTALLDPILMFWVLLAFGALLLDRDRTRRRLAELVRAQPSDLDALALGRVPGGRLTGFLGGRPWLWVAGALLGTACATKWSGLWFLAAFGLLAVGWDVGTRRLLGDRDALLRTLTRSVPLALVAIVGVAFVVYLVWWTGWLLSDSAYDRQWAATSPASGLAALVPDAFRSLWHYHAEAYDFHRSLVSPHAYQSNPWGWPLQARPTSYYFESLENGQGGCTTDKCATEVLALGNPVIWWAGALALLHQLWRWVGRRDWRSGAVIIAYLAGWVPWLFFQGRTIFTFYAVAYLPFLALALAMTLAAALGPERAPPDRRALGAAFVGVVVLAAVLASWWFYPVWTAQVIPYGQWQLRMWFPTWI